MLISQLNSLTTKERRNGGTYRLGGKSNDRIIYLHPAVRELYYLCLLLNEIKSARSYEDLRTIIEVVYATYRETCCL